MKLRRTLAIAAATAVIAPVALLSAPAAFASGSYPSDSSSQSATPTAPESAATTSTDDNKSADDNKSTDESKSTDDNKTADENKSTDDNKSADDSKSKTTSNSSESESESDDEDAEEEPTMECEPAPLDLSIKGLSGKIARGSGWHKFKFNIYNDSKTAVKNVMFFAAASADKNGENLFSTKQVRLQALNEETGGWEDVSEEDVAVGIVGAAEKIKPGYEVDIDLRINVKKSAPVGVGFSLGGGLVLGDDEATEPCFTDVAYKFQIVQPGDDDDTKPQEGGSIPVPPEQPDNTNAPQVDGNLAETGSSSATPIFALAGGAAIVLGAGAMFVVRRRKNGDAAA